MKIAIAYDSGKGNPHDLNRHGAWLGAMEQSDVDEPPAVTPIGSDLQTAAHPGQRVAEITRRLIQQI